MCLLDKVLRNRDREARCVQTEGEGNINLSHVAAGRCNNARVGLPLAALGIEHRAKRATASRAQDEHREGGVAPRSHLTPGGSRA